MAKSLLCKDCNTLFRNVAEAQSHNEVTGHANFEESMEVLKLLVCTACGKPCRSQAERDLHTRFTQHTEYVEKVRRLLEACGAPGPPAAVAALAACSLPRLLQPAWHPPSLHSPALTLTIPRPAPLETRPARRRWTRRRR
jgi:hypothetical protein